MWYNDISPSVGHCCAITLGKLLTSVCLCRQAVYNLVPGYRSREWCCLAGKVTAGLAETNGSLPLGYDWVTCGLTAKWPGSASSPTLVYFTVGHFYRASGYDSAVLEVVILSARLSVRPSVCLPHACLVTKPNNVLRIFWYRTKGQSL